MVEDKQRHDRRPAHEIVEQLRHDLHDWRAEAVGGSLVAKLAVWDGDEPAASAPLPDAVLRSISGTEREHRRNGESSRL